MKTVLIVIGLIIFILILMIAGIVALTLSEDNKLVKNRIWFSRKRNFLGLPWSFTMYSFDAERFYLDSGLLSKRQDELRLYRVLDISVTRSVLQRIFKMGTILINSSDKSLKNFEIKNIKDVMMVKEQLSQLVEHNRMEKHVMSREYITDDVDDMEGSY